MTNSPIPVSGYTAQSDENIALVNENKRREEEILRVLDEMFSMPETDKRWLSIGRTHIEQGFMAINRSVFRPKRIEGEL